MHKETIDEPNFEARLTAAELEITELLDGIWFKMHNDKNDARSCALCEPINDAVDAIVRACAIARDYARRPEGEGE